MPRRSTKHSKPSPGPSTDYAPTAHLLEQIEAAFLEFPARFTLGGAIPLHTSGLEGLALFYQLIEGQPARITLPLTLEAAAAFGDAPSGHQLPAAHFAFSVDPLTASGVLVQVQEYMELDHQLVALPKTLTARTQRQPSPDQVKSEDTAPKSTAAIGTIHLRLPSPFAGGELVVRNGDTEHVYSYPQASAAGALEWSFLTADCETEVRELSNGCCITVTYDVFPAPSAGAVLPDQRLVRQLKEALADPSFFPDGGVLAFALQQGYSVDRSCPRILGTDAVWEASLKAVGFEEVRFAELYGSDEHYESSRSQEQAGKRHSKRTAPFCYKDREYPWSFAFGGASDIEYVEPPHDLLYEWFKPEDNYPGQPVSWVTEHRKWGGTATYVVDFGGGDQSAEKNVAILAVVPKAGLRKCLSAPPEKKTDSDKGNTHGEAAKEGDDKEEPDSDRGDRSPDRKRTRTAR